MQYIYCSLHIPCGQNRQHCKTGFLYKRFDHCDAKMQCAVTSYKKVDNKDLHLFNDSHAPE